MRSRREERGATAILVALLTVAMMVLAGFVVDFGQAYVSKRNLQKASDAAALAAAAAFSNAPGDCEEIRTDPEATNGADTAVDRYREANRPDSTQTDYEVRCEDGALVVEYESSGSTQSFFGPLAGADDTITTSRRAEASLEVGTSTNKNARPLMLCSAQVPARAGTDQFVRIDYPGGGHSPPDGCPVPSTPGNWWLIDCPEERTGSANQLRDQIENGCSGGMSIVPTDGGEPGNALEAACPAAPEGSETCMSGNPGNITQGNAGDKAWKPLIQSGTETVFPIFCAPPDCSESTISDDGGTGAVFPIYRLAAAVVCGYHFAKNDKYGSTNGECAGNPHNVDGDGSDDNYLVLKLTQIRTSGSYDDYECQLGDACDTGLRRVRLTE